MRSIIFVLILSVCTVACSAQPQRPGPVANATTTAGRFEVNSLTAKDLAGEWFGESKCTGNNPSCHDEVVRYRFSEVAGDPSKIHLAADKRVNGKWDLMGEFDFTIDAAKNKITAEFTIPRTGGRGVWDFTVAGNNIDGVLMTYPENEVGRRVHVERGK